MRMFGLWMMSMVLLAGAGYGRHADSILTSKAANGVEIVLVRGVSPMQYWPSAEEGKVGEAERQGLLPARKIMYDSGLDWVIVALRVPDGTGVFIGRSRGIVIQFGDSTVAVSQRLLFVEGWQERQVWDIDTAVRVQNGKCPYGRTSGTGAYVMYAGYEIGLLARHKGRIEGDGVAARLAKQPVRVWLAGGE